MKSSIYIVLIFMLSCTSQTEKTINIKGDFSEKINDTIIIETDSLEKYLNQKSIKKRIHVKNGEFNTNMIADKGRYVLKSGKTKYNIYLQPGYDITLHEINGNLTFDGSGSEENSYLQHKTQFNEAIKLKELYTYYAKLEESEFLIFAKQNLEEKIALVKKYPRLSDKFKYLEINEAKINHIRKLNKYPFTRKFYDENYSISDNYPQNILSLIDINDEELLNLSTFKLMLFLQASNVKANSDKYSEMWHYILSDEYPVSNKKILQEILFFYSTLAMNGISDLDDFYKTFQSINTNQEYHEIVKKKYNRLTKFDKGKEAPYFSYQTIEKEEFQLNSLSGKVVFIDVWATWCKPCIEQFPAIEKLQEHFKNNEVALISIAIDSDYKKVNTLLKEYNIKGINLYDQKNEADFKKEYMIDALPHYILIDQNGRFVDYKTYKPSDKRVTIKIESLLN